MRATLRGVYGRLPGLSSVGLALVLAACGGSQEEASSGPSAHRLQTLPSDGASLALQSARRAALNTNELEQAEKAAVAADGGGASGDEPGDVVPKSRFQSGEVAQKLQQVSTVAYRFFNSRTGAHFFTISTTERDRVSATLSPPFSYEGPAFRVANRPTAGLHPVHRFLNWRTGVHFYTISENERRYIDNTLADYEYEGVAYYASRVAGFGLTPFYRFFVPGRGFHFYTASEAERDSIIANLSHVYRYEGVGYYVMNAQAMALPDKLPHTGITADQCIEYRSSVARVVPCGSAGAQALNAAQDGHRVSVNPMSYSEVPNSSGGFYARSECVKDDVTGLVWEGKTESGPRAGDARYTNLDNGLDGDVSAYVAEVNAVALCGYTDWRLPTRNELISIVDYGRVVKLNTDWFLNADFSTDQQSWYWTSEQVGTDRWDPLSTGFLVSFAYGWSQSLRFTDGYTGDVHRVRLVRGASPQAARYSFSTESYGTDAANNVVDDAWTGLRWRRCEEGLRWTGSTCEGTRVYFSDAISPLAYSNNLPGWRLPNIKELVSLSDLSDPAGTTRIDTTVFPNADLGPYASSTPTNLHPGTSLLGGGAAFYGAGFGSNANVVPFGGSAVRLVRDCLWCR